MGLAFPPQGRLSTDSHPHNCYGVNTMNDKATLFKPAILILAKSYSTARNRGMVMPSERAKRARAVERAGFI